MDWCNFKRMLLVIAAMALLFFSGFHVGRLLASLTGGRDIGAIDTAVTCAFGLVAAVLGVWAWQRQRQVAACGPTH